VTADGFMLLQTRSGVVSVGAEYELTLVGGVDIL
jgi:hypothetical protein